VGWHDKCLGSVRKVSEENPVMSDMSDPVRTSTRGHERALRILAKSVFRELKASGYGRTEIVGFTNELLDLVTGDFKGEQGRKG